MTPLARDSGEVAASTTRRVVLLLRTIVVLLALQFVLGIWVNLFGPVPSTNNLGVALGYTGDPALTGHYALAVVLVVLGGVLVVVAFRGGARPGLRGMVVLGLLSVLWASAAGAQFVLSGSTNSWDSFSMALAFIVATTFYGVAQALVLTGNPSLSARSSEPEGSVVPPGRGP